MDLQTVFYTVGTVAMVVFIILALSVVYFLFFVKKVIEETRMSVMNKLIEYTRPADVLKGLTSNIVNNIFLKLRENFRFR